MKLFARLMFLLVLALSAVSVGCSEQAPIRRYSVAKPPHRMLAGMMQADQEAWFFKLSGPRKEVGDLQAQFDDFLKSVDVDKSAASPTLRWQLPSSWKQLPGNADRYATIEIPGSDKPLELTVTRLPTPQGDWEAYRLQNVNRWRMQVRLGPIDQQQLAQELVELQGRAGQAISRVDLVGTLSNSKRSPMAGMGGLGGGAPGMGRMPPEGMEDETAEAGGLPIEFETPDGWKPGGRRPFVRLAFRIETKGGRAEVTVSSLVAASNDLLSNVNRWRGQLQLKDFSADELTQAVTPISLGGVEGAYVELVGEDPGQETILGVMAVHGDDAWFFKFKGPGNLAQREKSRFEAFVKSVRFKG